MQEESQFEITRALVTLMVCAVCSTIGGDIGSGISFSFGSGISHATLPGLLTGLVCGAALVSVLMKETPSHSNLS
jgi:ABC-type Mn2+/Zn2+ transport system permease subunit